MLALYILMCPWFCLVFVFAHGKAVADHGNIQWTAPTPKIIQLRGFYGGGANVYQQPVAGGENIILSCPALGKEFTKAFLHLAWSARSRIGSSTMYTDWNFIGGMNSTRHPHVEKPQKNAIDWRGFLSIRNVSKDQNGTEYRCTVWKVRYLDPDASFVELFVVDETASPSKNSLTCTTDVASKHSTASPTPRSHVTRTTDVTGKYSTGPTQSTNHEPCNISSDVTEAYGIGVPVGVVVGVFLAYAIYRYKNHRSDQTTRLTAGTCSNTDDEIEDTSV